MSAFNKIILSEWCACACTFFNLQRFLGGSEQVNACLTSNYRHSQIGTFSRFKEEGSWLKVRAFIHLPLCREALRGSTISGIKRVLRGLPRISRSYGSVRARPATIYFTTTPANNLAKVIHFPAKLSERKPGSPLRVRHWPTLSGLEWNIYLAKRSFCS